MREAEVFARYRGIIDDWEGFVAALARPLPTTLWVNQARCTPAWLAARVGQLRPLGWLDGAFRAAPGFAPGRSWTYLAGLLHVQEEVSMVPAQVLGAAPGERVLDLCAAPGNKTAQLSMMVGARGRVVANDRSIPRMRACRQTFERLGLLNVATTIYDATRFPLPLRPFDRVLVDAPCTGEGTCRKVNPRRWRASAAASSRMAATQLQILRRGVQQCRVGGRIVYSTCTFAPEENECVIDALLREGAPVRLLPARVPGLPSHPGLTRWAGRALDPSLAHAMRLWPQLNDSGGFFVALLERLDDGRPPLHEAPAAAPFVEQREPWLSELEARFGIDPHSFADCAVLRPGTKATYITQREPGPIEGLDIDALGMRFVHTSDRHHKMTTAAAIAFGGRARINSFELDPEQLRAFVARSPCSLSAAQSSQLSSGYVIPRFAGHALGVGVFRERERRLESMYPKGWARELDAVE